MSKKHYIFIFLLLLAGLTASVVLLPRDKEIAQMQVKDKLFAEAQQLYESELVKGDLSIAVVGQVTDLYVQGGAIDKAIALMEKFVAEHPENIEARERLGTYYQYAQRTSDYTRNLESINLLKPQAAGMKKLADTYQFNTEYDKQAAALQKLIETPGSRDPKHYMELANLLAAQKNYAQAIITLQQLKQTYPEHYGAKEAQLLVTLLYDQARKEEAFLEAKSWLEAHREPEPGATLIGIVHSKDSPEKAMELLALFTDKEINDTQSLLEEAILLQIALGKEEEAYARLKSLPEKQWSPVMLEQLLLLASAHGDDILVQALLPRIDLTSMTEAQLARLTEAATIGDHSVILSALGQKFPDATYGETYPLLSALLAVANKNATADAALTRLDNVALTPENMLQIARVCMRYGKQPCTDNFLNKLPEQEKLTDAQIVAVGELYLQSKQWEKGNAYVLEALKTRDSDSIRFISAKYAAAAGDETRLAEWLVKSSDTTPVPMLRDVYFTATNAGHYKAALLVAKTVYEKDKSLTSRRDLANTYIKLGQYDIAAYMLKPQEGKTLSTEDQDSYLLALSKLSKNPRYRRELADYAGNRLRANPPRKEKMALIYALINSEQADVAMPAIRELALSEGGQWASLYAEALDKQGKHDEARIFWMKVAEKKLTPEKEKTAIAYHLLDRGYKKDAEIILTRQATIAKPKSQEVMALLYIWGPHLNQEQMEWLSSRYNQSEDEDKEQWAAHIANYASAETLPSLLRTHPELIQNHAVLKSYLEALIEDGRFSGSDRDFIDNAQKSGRTDLLRVYADTARERGFTRESRNTFAALVALDRQDTAATREAGLIAFDQADYSASGDYLNRYLKLSPSAGGDAQSYRAYFQYAELMRRNNQPQQALHYYQLAYQTIEDNKVTTPEAVSIKAQSQLGMGNSEAGIATYKRALTQYPNDAVLRADYIAGLLELKRYREARAVLAATDETTLKPILEATLPMGASDIAGYQLLNGDREIVVTFNKPVDRGTSITADHVTHMPWAAYSTEGYDTLLIAAKPGYRLVVDGNAGVARTLRAQAETGASREIEQSSMRYELLHARLDLETGEVDDAVRRMNRLVARHPHDPQVLGFAANAENYGGNWPEALQLLKTAQALAPENEDIALLRRNIRREHGPQAMLDFEWISRGPSNEYVSTFSALTDATRNLQVGAMMANDDVHAKRVRLADGRIGNFSGNRQQAEIFLRYHDQPGRQAQFSIFANNVSPGAGGYVQFLNPLGQTQVIAEYRKPYWEYTQGVLDDAMRSRAAVVHTVKPKTNFTLSGGPGINRYDVDDTNNVATMASVEFDAVYRLIDAQPYLSISYSLDGEYDLSHKKGLDSNGGFTHLFPLRSREVHFVSLRSGWEFDDATYAEGMLGYGVDRFGGSGPAIEGRVTHEFTESLDGQIRAYYGLDAANTDNNLSRVGGYVRWRF